MYRREEGDRETKKRRKKVKKDERSLKKDFDSKGMERKCVKGESERFLVEFNLRLKFGVEYFFLRSLKRNIQSV